MHQVKYILTKKKCKNCAEMFRTSLKRAGKFVKYGSLLGIGGSSLIFLHKNDYDLSSIGLMRLGRAAYAV